MCGGFTSAAIWFGVGRGRIGEVMGRCAETRSDWPTADFSDLDFATTAHFVCHRSPALLCATSVRTAAQRQFHD